MTSNPATAGYLAAAISTPVGPVRITGRDETVQRVVFLPDGTPPMSVPSELAQIAAALIAALTAPADHTPLTYDLSDVGEFETRVLQALLDIPRGETRSYGEIAAMIGQPGATQAVGNAVGRNPIPILIPCHRVIRADGSLGGFSGPIGMKRRLLALEGVTLPEQLGLELP